MEDNYEYIHKFTSEQKLKWWGDGEWVEEADELIFEHLGFKCRIVRIWGLEGPLHNIVFGGYLCGYISILKDHPYYKKDYYEHDLDIYVHGGITFSSECNYNDEYWLGFDCGHGSDIIPSTEKMFNTDPQFIKIRKEYINILQIESTYKNIAYCIGECKSMAEQLAGVKKE